MVYGVFAPLFSSKLVWSSFQDVAPNF